MNILNVCYACVASITDIKYVVKKILQELIFFKVKLILMEEQTIC